MEMRMNAWRRNRAAMLAISLLAPAGHALNCNYKPRKHIENTLPVPADQMQACGRTVQF